MKQWRWYHGVLFYAGVQAVSLGAGKLVESKVGKSQPKAGESLVGNESNNDFYNSLRLPRFAPPDWVFAPAWTLNNVLCIWGLLHVCNLPKGQRGRAEFLALQGGVWTLFAAFPAFYFGLRSPISGAIITKVSLLATIASVYVAIYRLKDTKAALSQSTILPWLLLASATATTVAAWNKDEFFETEPLVDSPPDRWMK